MTYAKFYTYNDKRWRHVRTINTTAKKAIEVIAFVESNPKSMQYHYEIFKDEKKLADIYTFNNCLFD